MDKNILIFTLIVIHIIGAITTIIMDYKTGTFKWAAKHGDGIRFANPSDVLFLDLVVWEIQLLLFIMCSIEVLINNFFYRHYQLR